MQYTNTERINIYKSIFKFFRKSNIVDIDLPKNFIDGIACVREKKLLNIEPHQDDKFLMSFWTKYKDGVLLFFPTPPYDKKPIEDKINNFIQDTRNIIDEMMKTKPKKIYLDLRCNNGGFIHVFYNSLYSILPKYDGLILSGVDLNGKEIMQLKEEKDELILTIDDPINGKMLIDKKIGTDKKYKLPEIEVLVNTRTASSAEMIMIMYSQKGYKVTGEPTMGLTSGMLTQFFDEYNVHIPYYWFKDLNGKIYSQETRQKPIKDVSQTAKLIEGNVIAKIPEKIIKNIDQSTSFPMFNHIHCQYLKENSHFGIDHNMDNPNISITNRDSHVYVCVPEGTNQTLKEVFDKHSNDILSHKPIIIDIRNAKLKGDNAIELFCCMFKPYEVPLKTTTNDIDKPGSFYISASYPYISINKVSSIHKYANINAKIWINKNSIVGDCKSTVLLKYLIWSFGLVEGSTFGNFFDYSFHNYLITPFNINVYTCRYV